MTVFVLHPVGDPDAGAPWRAAFSTAPAAVVPDLPGHGSAPAPLGGSYELADVADAVSATIDALPSRPLVVGIGNSGWAATCLALGGRAAGLVLVDGWGGPWRTPDEVVAATSAWLRGIADDPAAHGPAPADGLDPRAAHTFPDQTSERLARRAAVALGGLGIPSLSVTTPDAVLSPGEIDALTSLVTGMVTVHLADRSPRRVADAITHWWGGGASRTPTDESAE